MMILFLLQVLSVQVAHADCNMADPVLANADQIWICDNTRFDDLKVIKVAEWKDGSARACEENTSASVVSVWSEMTVRPRDTDISTFLSEWYGYTRELVRYEPGYYSIIAQDECSASTTIIGCH